MKTPLVSIGIPVYNVEPYIDKCIESVLNQTYRNIEILIIDDCGNDKSMQIVEWYKNNKHNGGGIRIIHHNINKGLGEARNTAIDNARGKYIYFVDSDDYIELEAISILVNEAEKYGTDVVMASSRKIVYDTGELLSTFVYHERRLIVGEDAFPNYLCKDLRWHIGINAWNNLFLTEFLLRNNLRFAARKDEDALFLSDFYSEVKCAVLLPNVTYNYVIRPGSIMGNQSRDKIPTREIRERFLTDAVMTERCYRLKERSFYDVHCARVIKHKFRAVCVALRHRRHFTEPLSNEEIKSELQHPASFAEIVSFKRYKFFNLFFYVVGKMPSSVFVRVSFVVGKLIRWI